MKLLKKYFWLASIGLVLMSGCTIRFDKTPNNLLNEFPEEYCGRYLFTSRQQNDSTYIIIKKDNIQFMDQNILRGGFLSDSIKLAKGPKYLYLCQQDSLKDRLVWDIYPMKLSGNKLYMYALDADLYKKSIKKCFVPIEGYDNFYKMDQEKLDRFSKKKLKTKNALKLIKVESF